MTYRKKLIVLSALAAVLALAYILTFVFESGSRRGAAFAWLDHSLLPMADAVEIYGMDGARTVLLRKNNIWVFQAEGNEYPVKQARVADLFAALSQRAVYMERASSAEARQALSLEEGSASRIIVRGGAGLPLLDLLIGGSDALRREVYLRRAGRNEIYSGEDLFTLYTEGHARSWYDLRLFPPGALVDAVQQAELSLTSGGPDGEETVSSFLMRRGGGGWHIPGSDAVLDSGRVETWIRWVLETEADDFAAGPPETITDSITLRLGDGSSRVVQAGFTEDGQSGPQSGRLRIAQVSGSHLAYLLSDWAANRLFIEESYFHTQ